MRVNRYLKNLSFYMELVNLMTNKKYIYKKKRIFFLHNMKRKKVETRKKLFLIFFKTICFVILGLRF